MKIYLSSDMEGTAGVVEWEQCRPTYRTFVTVVLLTRGIAE